MGARVLYAQLKRHHFLNPNNNGKIYLSQRRALEEMGAGNRDSIGRWFAELEHFGFIVKTAEGCLGIDGKGKAPQWRLTELDTPYAAAPRATRDFERWDGTPFKGDQSRRATGGAWRRVRRGTPRRPSRWPRADSPVPCSRCSRNRGSSHHRRRCDRASRAAGERSSAGSPPRRRRSDPDAAQTH